METVKEKIQRIKLSRMGEEHQFVARMFSDLVPHTTKSKPNKIYFLQNDVPVFLYDKKANYLWCHHEIWNKLHNLVVSNSQLTQMTNTIMMGKMREILGHFALAYYDMSDTTISMAHSYITETWKLLKFKRVYVW